MGRSRAARPRGAEGRSLPVAACPAHPAHLLGGRPHRAAHAERGSRPRAVSVGAVSPPGPDLQPPPVVARHRRDRLGPGVDPFCRGLVLPGPSPHSRGARLAPPPPPPRPQPSREPPAPPYH